MSDRYQYQSRPVRLYRWLRYMPLGYVKAGWYIILWVLHGCPIDESVCESTTYRAMIQNIYQVCVARAQFKMEYYYTLEELLAGMNTKDSP